MKAKHLLFVAAVAIALLILRLLLVGPEERIRRELDAIAEEASKSGVEKPLIAATKARSISRSFTEQAHVLDLRTGRDARGRDALAQAVGWARESWDAGELFFEDLEVEMLGDEAARTRARVRILDDAGAPASIYDGTAVSFEWAQVGGDWLVVRGEAETPAQ